MKSLKLMYSYLTDRYQRVKINDSLSEWYLIKYGVPQGSILGPLLFNIFLCDMFLILENVDIASYADDNTPYTTGQNQVLKLKFEEHSSEIFKWFGNNAIKSNQDKCHFLSSLDLNTEIILDKCGITNSNSGKLLGIHIDRKLNFNEHVSKLCKKASSEIHP